MKTEDLEKRKEWEEDLLTEIVKIGREKYEASFFAEMLIKLLWVLQDD